MGSFFARKAGGSHAGRPASTGTGLALGLVLAGSLMVSGCASKSYAVLLDSPDGSTGAIIVTNDKGSALLNETYQAVELDGANVKPFAADSKKVGVDFAAALAAQPALPQTYLMYFKLNATALTPESEALVPEVFRTVRERGKSVVAVTGHTDTLGGEAANEKLALERARMIANMLQSNGLQAIELVVSSDGERNLLLKTPDNTAEPRNRRVEVTIR
jgi:outer membrane protein OmpA-like peptidoglycan-associated protein